MVCLGLSTNKVICGIIYNRLIPIGASPERQKVHMAFAAIY